jgi:glycosyltransferase involved in cell wall biosynthesis
LKRSRKPDACYREKVRKVVGVILLATLGESDSITPVLEEASEAITLLGRFGYTLSILIVDDSMDDEITKIANRCSEHWSILITLIRGPNRGLGAAISHGMYYATRQMVCDLVINLDADGQHDARQIPDLLRAHLASEADITIGSRWTRGGRSYGLSVGRKLVSRVSALTLRATSVPWSVKDPTTSFRVYSKDVVETCLRDTVGFSGFSFFGSIIAVAAANGKKIVEVPIHYRPRLAGRSKLRFAQIAQAAIDLLRVRARAKMISRRESYDFFAHRIPSPQHLVDENDSYIATGILECLAADEKTAKRIGQLYAEDAGSTILEVGGGLGQNTDFLKLHHRHVTVLEPDSDLYANLKKKFETFAHIDVFHGDLQRYCDSTSTRRNFDSAVYINVLEHIEDDISELIQVRSMLNDEGRIIIFVPALPSLYGTMDGQSAHFRRYSKRELITIAHAAGFEVEKCAYFDPLGVFVYLAMYRILKISRLGTGSVFLYDKVLLPLSEWIARITRHRVIGKNLIMIARISDPVPTVTSEN